MADVSYTDLRGLGVPDPRWKPGNLKARDTGSTDSAYTEASPVAGTPEPSDDYDMVLRARGTCSQEAHIRVRAHRAGMPGIDRGGFIWDDQTQSTPVWYGADGPQLVTGWETLRWTSVAASWHDPIPHVIRLINGTLLSVHSQQNNAAKTLKVSSYAPSTSTWTEVNVTLDDAAEQEGPCLVQLPDERVLLFVQASDDQQVDVYYSDDNGATWAIYARRVLVDVPGTADIRQLRAAYSRGEILLLVAFRDGSSNRDACQYASSDLGCSFEQIVSSWRTSETEDPESLDVVEATGGGFVFAYADNDGTTSPMYSRRVGSAFDDLSAADSVSVGTGLASASLTSLAMFRGEDGALYTFCDLSTSGANAALARSEDDGLTWATFGAAAHRGLSLDAGVTGAGFKEYSAAMIGGRVALVTRWDAGTADEDDQSIGVIWLGGSTTHTAPATNDPTGYHINDQVIFNERMTDNVEGGIYLPIEEPDNVGWSLTAGSNGSSDLISPGHLEITTSAQNQSYTRDIGPSGKQALFVEFAVQATSGGSTSADDIAAVLEIGDGSATEYEVRFRVGSAGWALWDPNNSGGTNIITGSADFTSPVWVRIAIDDDDVFVWTSEEAKHGHVRTWTSAGNATVTDAGGASGRVRMWFGNFGTGTATSEWLMFGYCNWAGTWGPQTSSFADAWTSPDDLQPRAFSTQPALVYDSIEVWAVDGPAKLGDTWAIKQDSQYSAQHLFWQTEPSPSRFWRSVDDSSDAVFVIDLSGLTSGDFLSSCLFVTLLGINFNRADLERWDGAAWQTIATVQANDGLTSLQQQRYGDVIEPLKGGATHKAARYIFEGDLVGGTAKLSGDPTPLRKVLWNTSGAWTDESSTRPAAQLDGVDDTEASTGSLEFWMPQVSAVITEHTATNRLYRIKIPTQETADGYYQCGQILVGHVHVFGRHYSRGWTVESRPVFDLQDLANGSSRAVRRGPLLREIEIGWPDGDDAMDVQAASPVPDYISGSTSGLELASPGQTLRALAGLVKQADGGVHPVVYFGRIERTSGATTIANPRQFLYGRVVSSVTRTNVLGDEQVDELDRGEAITIREIK